MVKGWVDKGGREASLLLRERERNGGRERERERGGKYVREGERYGGRVVRKKGLLG